ncbi:MAG TPA: hypothetical protein VD902_22755 [Symbiobacteriaceae bacterium]|nr:hypothetical protein [Symbiobacteriaceae bacterium]
MSATTAVKEAKEGRLGVMVRTPTELFVYWQGARQAGDITLRVSDLSGRPAAQSLDGRGYRDIEAASTVYVPNLLPGHLYYVEVGRHGPEGFYPLMGAGPVQTPWKPGNDAPEFPAPYHRS